MRRTCCAHCCRPVRFAGNRHSTAMTMQDVVRVLQTAHGSHNPTATEFVERSCHALYRNSAMPPTAGIAYCGCMLQTQLGVRGPKIVT
jgi:hypothetical protein